jgi:hypothetical protein
MHDKGIEAEHVCAIELFPQRAQRLQSERRISRGDVDEIAVVCDDRADAGLGHTPSKQDDFVGWERPRAPLTRGLGENLERLAFRRDGAIDGAGQTAGD